MIKILLSFAAPIFLLSIFLAWQREVSVPTIGARGGIRWTKEREARNPRLAGILLMLSFVMAGAALALYLGGAQ